MSKPCATPTSIQLGRKIQVESHFGFSGKPPSQVPPEPDYLDELINYDGDSHLMTIAPTGKGKGVSAIIPTLLDYPGSVIVFDPKGENYQITARRRRELGQRVIVLNPFDVLTDKTDSLNPLDLLQLKGADIETDAQMLASMLSSENRGVKDPFWDIHGCSIISGLITYIATSCPDDKRTLNELHKMLHSDDVIYQLAVLLDTCGTGMNELARQEIAAFLQHPEKETRGSVKATATSYIKTLAGGGVKKVLETSSFSLQDFVDGEPLSIYIIIPASKLTSHRGLLKMLMAVLLAAVMTRENKPETPTLFMLDEAAQLGNFPLLEQAVTLCRGYGMKVWTFWQDLAQLQQNYPASWVTLFNNCDIKQIFGVSSQFQAQDWSLILEHSCSDLLRLKNHEQLLVLPDGSESICQKLNYLNDAQFAGLFDDNPRYENKPRKRSAPDLKQYLPKPKKDSEKKDDSSDGNKKPR